MSTHEDRSTADGKALKPEERTFVARIGDAYTPAPWTASQQASFDRRLRKRLERRTRPAWNQPLPIAVAAAAVLAVCLFLWRGAPGSTPGTPSLELVTEDFENGFEFTIDDTTPSTAEDTLLALGTDAIADTDDALPDDYVAIQSLFLGGS